MICIRWGYRKKPCGFYNTYACKKDSYKCGKFHKRFYCPWIKQTTIKKKGDNVKSDEEIWGKFTEELFESKPEKQKKKYKKYKKRITIGILFIFIICVGYLCLPLIYSLGGFPTEVMNGKIMQGVIKDTPASLITQLPEIISPNYNQSPKTTTYPYVFNGNHKSISFTTYGGLFNHLSEKSHTYQYNPNDVIMELLENNYQDKDLQPLVEIIKKSSTNPDSQAKIAISLVQHIPYNWDGYYAYYSTSPSKDWYYPYETLYNNKGVCADKSILLAYLLNELGYDTVLFEFSDHMAVGVKSSSNYDFYDTGYVFIETTRPTIITYIPDTYLGGFKITPNPKIIHLNGGKKSLDVITEYNDAIKMKQLEKMGDVLDQNHYSEWMRISNNYDTQYDT